MKKIFIVAGEVSGDKLGAWYLQNLQKTNKDFESQEFEAVGGSFLSDLGVKLYENLNKLNVAGLAEIIKSLPYILKFLKKLTNYILKNNFQEVVLIDFPGFNLMLAKRLKKANPDIKITYLSPPQLWAWGQWRVKKLKKYCDRLIVLYPFEVQWYKERGLKAEYLGNPVYSRLKDSFDDWQFSPEYLKNKKNQIAIIPASRNSELQKLLPIFVDLVRKIKLLWPDLKIVLPLAESFSISQVQASLRKAGLSNWGSDLVIVQGEKEKLKELSQCCLAITKPGTITLELALLKVPFVAFYKTSWLTYMVAKILVKIKYMTLPNLLAEEVIVKEFIQRDCKANLVFNYVGDLYKSSLLGTSLYKQEQEKLYSIEKLFNSANL